MEVTNNKTRELIEIYGSNCWMGYTVSKHNPYTFHHIRKESKGGRREIQNGALLTRVAHDDLHKIEHVQRCKCYYRELNELFKELNKTRKPPTIEFYKEVNSILKKVSKKVDLSPLYDPDRKIKIVDFDDYEFDGTLLIPKTRIKCIDRNA